MSLKLRKAKIILASIVLKSDFLLLWLGNAWKRLVWRRLSALLKRFFLTSLFWNQNFVIPEMWILFPSNAHFDNVGKFQSMRIKMFTNPIWRVELLYATLRRITPLAAQADKQRRTVLVRCMTFNGSSAKLGVSNERCGFLSLEEFLFKSLNVKINGKGQRSKIYTHAIWL